MAWDSGVTVEIISDGQSLPLYPDPDAGDNQGTEGSVQYVEAVTGAKFEIRLTLEKNFWWGGCDFVEVIVKYDGDEIGWAYKIYNKGPKNSTSISQLVAWCPASNQWKSGYLSFGALQTSTTSGFRY